MQLTPTDDVLLLIAALVVLVTSIVLLVRARATGRRIRTLTARVRAWHGSEDPELLGRSIGGDAAWQQLTGALDALAGSYRDRGATLSRERPWRVELVDALAQPAILFDSDGRLQASNTAARGLLDLPATAKGLTVTEALTSSAVTAAVRRARELDEPVTLDVERSGRDLRVTVSLIGDESLVLVSDRTSERRIDDLRRDFVVNASHELKTPVTAIQTLAEALEVTLRNDPERAASLVRRLNGEAERLAQLVGDLLDLRRLEDVGPQSRVAVDLAELARRAAAEAIPRAEERGITVEVDAPERAIVAGVPADLEAVVKNLVSNAVKYNRDGGRVDVTLTTERGARRLSVADTGIGIRQQDLPRVFERFYRVDSARSRATGGTGLGLSIVRHAVERHGGTVHVESTLGEGTTFTVSIPIEAHG
jgi:signal transduction histidine kinase